MANVEIEFTRVRTVTYHEAGVFKANVPKHILDGDNLAGWLVENYTENPEFARRVDDTAEASENTEANEWDDIQVSDT